MVLRPRTPIVVDIADYYGSSYMIIVYDCLLVQNVISYYYTACVRPLQIYLLATGLHCPQNCPCQ